MTPQEQLEIITSGKVYEAVRDHLGGDWNRIRELFTIRRAQFDAWAYQIQLPFGRVTNRLSAHDGVYVIPQGDEWLVFEQERGIRFSETFHYDYDLAKQHALAMELLKGLDWMSNHVIRPRA